MGQFQSYPVVNEVGYWGQLSQTLFENQLKPDLAQYLVSLVHLGWCKPSVQGTLYKCTSVQGGGGFP